jgi:hypothetical protein
MITWMSRLSFLSSSTVVPRPAQACSSMIRRRAHREQGCAAPDCGAVERRPSRSMPQRQRYQ